MYLLRKGRQDMHKIAIITCYIGKFPEWFQLWLNSCEYNNTFDFWVYTDQDKSAYQLSDNIYWENTSLVELKQKISNICGFDILLDKAYKLCDYKPLYGLIFEDYRLLGGMIPFEEVARTKAYCGFDEHTGITRIFIKNGFKTYAKVVCADIDPHYKAFYMMDEDSTQKDAIVINFACFRKHTVRCPTYQR